MTDKLRRTHLVTVRAAHEDVDGPHVELVLGHVGKPTDDDLARYESLCVQSYTVAFEQEPDRVGASVLPWVGVLDDDDAEPADDEPEVPEALLASCERCGVHKAESGNSLCEECRDGEQELSRP
jgi:hypothetical protein